MVFPLTRVHFLGHPQHPAIAQYAIKNPIKIFPLTCNWTIGTSRLGVCLYLEWRVRYKWSGYTTV